MTAPLPHTFRFEGDGRMQSLRPKRADAEFVIGQQYLMAPIEERSAKAHAAYFATINEAWKNLPEDQAERWPTAEHLRKFALIELGFADCREIVCATNSEAVRLAALVKSMDSYSLAAVADRVVRIWTAKSQSYRVMGKRDFQASQTAVREFCAALISVAPDELERARFLLSGEVSQPIGSDGLT